MTTTKGAPIAIQVNGWTYSGTITRVQPDVAGDMYSEYSIETDITAPRGMFPGTARIDLDGATMLMTASEHYPTNTIMLTA